MSKVLIFALSMLTLISAHANTFYKVTITNLTKGQPLTPPVLFVHHPSVDLIKLGSRASTGIEYLARDGKTNTFVKELDQNRYVAHVKVGTGAILPGKTQTIKIEANDPRYKLSVVAMLGRTNDAIMVVNGASLAYHKSEYLADVLDAGVEVNTESCYDIPAPPCKSPNKGQDEDGLIIPHPGIQNIGDLMPLRDAFANKAALVKVELVH